MREDTVTLTIKRIGQTTVTVDRSRYEAAKAAGQLDQFLEPYVSDIDHDTTVMEPDGTPFDPYR